MVRCSCGCGEDIHGPAVGVNTPSGMIAFKPEHHKGTIVTAFDNPKPLMPGYVGMSQYPTKLDAEREKKSLGKIFHVPLKVGSGRKVRGKRWFGVYMRRDHYKLYSKVASKVPGLNPCHRRNIAPIVAAIASKEAPHAIQYGKGAAGRVMGMNPISKKAWGLAMKEAIAAEIHWRKTGKWPSKISKRGMLALGSRGWPRNEIYYRQRMQRVRRNGPDGTINVHNSDVESITYKERGTGIPYRHKFKKGKIKVRRGKIEISPAKVAPEGIVS